MYSLKKNYWRYHVCYYKNPHETVRQKTTWKKPEERLKLWNEGNIEEIIQETKTIQNRFRYSTTSRHTHEDSACSFAKLMLEGKASAALKMLSKDFDNGVVKLD